MYFPLKKKAYGENEHCFGINLFCFILEAAKFFSDHLASLNLSNGCNSLHFGTLWIQQRVVIHCIWRAGFFLKFIAGFHLLNSLVLFVGGQ